MERRCPAALILLPLLVDVWISTVIVLVPLQSGGQAACIVASHPYHVRGGLLIMLHVSAADSIDRPAHTHPQTRHAQQRYRLRLHRAQSIVLTPEELIEIRAAQRTFEGAYIRTSLGQFSFALVVLKIFTSEFYSIGALFAVYGAGVLGVSAFRRMQGNRQFFSEVGEDGLSRKRFRTSGNVVVVLTSLSVAAYVALLVLTLRLDGV